MDNGARPARIVRFGMFEADLQAGELRKNGLKIPLQEQPFQVCAILLQNPGRVVTREELRKELWPEDTFVDFEHGLNTAINKIRHALDDSAENPRFVQTLPRRGYRFIAPINGDGGASAIVDASAPLEGIDKRVPAAESKPRRVWRLPILIGTCVLLTLSGFYIYKKAHKPLGLTQRPLTRVTFDDGLQVGVTWSPDGRFIAYSSDRGGKFDIWIQQVSGGNPVQVTKRPGQNWQPDWSPDGKFIAYRSEDGEGGLFVVPALGGEGLERKIASFGYNPQWSPDGSQILFHTLFAFVSQTNRFYVVGLDGGEPREVLADFISKQKLPAISAGWYPDGKRITVFFLPPGAFSPDCWTAPFEGGVATRLEFAPVILKQLIELSGGAGKLDGVDIKFSWAPSGKAIYFGLSIQGARNLWKMTVDQKTSRVTAIERLTAGPGPDSRLDLSADGGRLAFTAGTRRIRTWLFPFSATKGQVSGPGQAVTSPGVEAWDGTLSPDGNNLAFVGIRSGRTTIWEKSLLDGHEAPIIDDVYFRERPQWSRDGMRLAYRRWNPSTGDCQIMVWSNQNHTEEPLTHITSRDQYVYDWSPDGERLLITTESEVTHRYEIRLLPVGHGTVDSRAAPTVISDPSYDLFQSRFSADGRWIVFEAIKYLPKPESAIYLVPAAGGRWTRITKGGHWDDKPCWSADGKTIYFVSGTGGFFSVWGIRFDVRKGKPIGESFRVVALEKPSLMVPVSISYVGLSITHDKLAITALEQSGSIWVLDNVDK